MLYSKVKEKTIDISRMLVAGWGDSSWLLDTSNVHL